MSPNTVIKALDILEDDLPDLPTSLERHALHTFTFQCPEKGFGDRITVTVPSAAHTHRDANFKFAR
jgi:hypothetical protein